MASSVRVQLTTAVNGVQYAVYELNHRVVSASEELVVLSLPGHVFEVGDVLDVRSVGLGTGTYKWVDVVVTEVDGDLVKFAGGLHDFPVLPAADTVVCAMPAAGGAICDWRPVRALIREIHRREWMAWMPLTVFPFVGTGDDLGAVDWDAETEVPSFGTVYDAYWAGVHWAEALWNDYTPAHASNPEDDAFMYDWCTVPTYRPWESYANGFGPPDGQMPSGPVGWPTHARNVVYYFLGICAQILETMARCTHVDTIDHVYGKHRFDDDGIDSTYYAAGELRVRFVDRFYGDDPMLHASHPFVVGDSLHVGWDGETEIFGEVTEVGWRLDPDDLNVIYLNCTGEPTVIDWLELTVAETREHVIRAIWFEWVPVPIVSNSAPGEITTLVDGTHATIYAPGHGLEVGDTCHIHWYDSFDESNGYVVTRNGDRDGVLAMDLPSGYVFRAGDVVNVFIDDGMLHNIYAMDVTEVVGPLMHVVGGIASDKVLPVAGEETGKVVVTLCQDDTASPHVLFGNPYRIGMTVDAVSEDGRSITVSGGVGGNTLHAYMDAVNPGDPQTMLGVQRGTFVGTAQMQAVPATPLDHGEPTPGYQYTRACWIDPRDPVDIASLETVSGETPYYPSALVAYTGPWRVVSPDGAEADNEQACPHDSPIAGAPVNGARINDVNAWGGRGTPFSMYIACHIILTHLTRMLVGVKHAGGIFVQRAPYAANPGLARYWGNGGAHGDLVHEDEHDFPDAFGARPLGIWPEVE